LEKAVEQWNMENRASCGRAPGVAGEKKNPFRNLLADEGFTSRIAGRARPARASKKRKTIGEVE